MKYTEIESKILESQERRKSLSAELKAINSEIYSLTQLRLKKESNLLIEYLGINSTIEIWGWINFLGVQIDIKETPITNGKTNIWKPTFEKGDLIQIIKINNKSIVIKCITKIIRERCNGHLVQRPINPESKFRIDVESFRSNMFLQPDFKKNFQLWIQREESLREILGDGED